jgi:hypothetical protein
MREDQYSYSPEVIHSLPDYKSLTAVQKAYVHDVLAYLWSTDKKYESRLSSVEICVKMHWDQNDIDALCPPSIPGIIEEGYDLTTGDFTLISPFLKGKKSEYDQWVAAQLERVEARKKERARTTLAGRIEAMSKSPSVAYVLPRDRCHSSYPGWLPTNRFESSGQAYIVSEDSICELKKLFPASDIGKELDRMYKWLMENPERRKPLAALNGFMRNWVKTSTGQAFVPGISQSSRIDGAFEEMDTKSQDTMFDQLFEEL